MTNLKQKNRASDLCMYVAVVICSATFLIGVIAHGYYKLPKVQASAIVSPSKVNHQMVSASSGISLNSLNRVSDMSGLTPVSYVSWNAPLSAGEKATFFFTANIAAGASDSVDVSWTHTSGVQKSFTINGIVPSPNYRMYTYAQFNKAGMWTMTISSGADVLSQRNFLVN